MAATTHPEVLVVDGGALARQGRAHPCLPQLADALGAIHHQFPAHNLIVIIDSALPHEVTPAEQRIIDQARLDGHLTCPPAGAVGGVDAFLNTVADHAGGRIVSVPGRTLRVDRITAVRSLDGTWKLRDHQAVPQAA